MNPAAAQFKTLLPLHVLDQTLLGTSNNPHVAVRTVIQSGQCGLVGGAVMRSHGLLHAFKFKHDSAFHHAQFIDGGWIASCQEASSR